MNYKIKYKYPIGLLGNKTKRFYMSKKLHFETLQLHVGQEQADSATDSRAVPIYQTTNYVFHNSQHASDRFGLKDAGNIYGRLTNSTQDVLEKESPLLKAELRHLPFLQGRPQSPTQYKHWQDRANISLHKKQFMAAPIICLHTHFLFME